MFGLSPDTAVRLVLLTLGIGILLGLASGAASLRRSQILPFYSLRRRAVEQAYRYFITAGVFTMMAVVAALFGRQSFTAAENIIPSATPTASLTPTRTHTLTPTPTWIPSPLPGTPTVTLTPSATPTETGTPQLPLFIVTPILSPTVTPPAEAVVGPISISPIFDYPPLRASEYFEPTAKTLYALFEYDHFARGMQWSAVWYRDAAPIFIETIEWNDPPGGWGFSEYQPPGEWPLGTYEVRIFAGERWLRSKTFYVVEVLPTNTPRPPRTPSPPTDTPTP